MNRILRRSLATSGVLTFATLGCNAILDNQPAVAGTHTEAAAFPDPDAGSDASSVPACPAGEQFCFGSCVSMTDPLYGCGAPSCSPCASARSTMGCQGRKCVVTACDPGYAGCGASAGDGCDTDLSKAASCGSCNAACGGAKPLCAPSDGSFQCTDGCSTSAPLACGAECVDPKTSANHCGGCNVKCPEIANGTTACAGGLCGLTCKPQFHVCGAACVASTDPATCGATCTPCPVPPGGTATCVNDVCGVQCPATAQACGGKCVTKTDPTACGPTCAVCPAAPPNAAATCTADACGFTCGAGFGNCDANAVNGCETNTVTNAAHCGLCGKACLVGQTCVNSVCL
jgi:hypothetical protein